MKSSLGNRMKGQAVFEFVIAALILFSIIMYVISYMSTSFDLHHELFKSNRLEASALRVSDIIISDPENGIVDSWPNMSVSRMNDFHDACNQKGMDGEDVGYFDLLEKFNLRDQTPYSRYTQLNIRVIGDYGDVYVDCGRTPFDEGTKGTVTRFGYVPERNQAARIVVTVW